MNAKRRDSNKARGSNPVPVPENGIDLLRQFDPHPGLLAADRWTWMTWYRFEELLLWQLVALHSSLDPESLGEITDGVIEAFVRDNGDLSDVPTDNAVRFRHNLNTAAAAVEDGELGCVEIADDLWYSTVRVAAFHAWSRKVRLPVVGGWPGSTSQSSSAPKTREDLPAGRWPWGDHTTPMLEWLATTAKAMWTRVDEGGQYDPADDLTAPTNDEVADWLAGAWPDSSNRCREFFATILRPPHLPPGRRTRRSRRSK